jgi:predicted ester cyclase
MSGRIDFQIAEGDLVATRWQWDYRPRRPLMRLTMIGGRNPIPIVNVFRFKDGKIIEIWNHRHESMSALPPTSFVPRGSLWEYCHR